MADDMMCKQVIISIRSEQAFEGSEKDSTEFVTEGTLTATQYGSLLEYDESALTGMEGTHTAFQIRPSSVALIRTGAFRSQMIFELGKKHYSPYNTPYGTMMIDIITSELHNLITEDGGTLEIVYAIEIEHQVAGENRFLINVRPKSKKTT